MSTPILLPKIGFSMNEGMLTEWLVADGSRVELGQPLFVIESDKSANEIEAPAAGTLRILAATDETYEVGTILGHID